MFKPELYIEGQRVTLFAKENIRVNSSVQNIEDISRIFNDFSQSFSVPASKNNNKIFKHFYNFSINNGFDARIRHDANIDINGIPLKKGSFRLEKAVTSNGKIQSYRGTFFGELIDLKEVIGEDYLSSLDLSAYDIDYDSANVITGITTGYSSEDYVFPLISTKRQWFYNSDIGVTTYTDTLANIAWNGSAANHGAEWTSFRPALKIMRIIEAIETKYGISFSRTFLGTTPFDNLYLWLAGQDAEDTLTNTSRVDNYDSFSTSQPPIGSFDNASGAYNISEVGIDYVDKIIFDTNSSDGVLYTIQLMNNDQVMAEETGTGDLRIDQEFGGQFQEGASIYGRIITTASKLIDECFFKVEITIGPTVSEVLRADKDNFTVEGASAAVNNLMPKLKVIDFLNSIFKLYNLTVLPTSKTVFDVETLDVWYSNGNIIDISPYVDRSKDVDVSRATIYREISFNFQEPGTILADQFNKTNNTAYGDLSTKLKTADGTTLDGESYEIEVDFEQMVYEKLLNLNTEDPTNIVYGLSLDRGLSAELPEAHLLYIQKKSVSANSIGVVDDTGTKQQINGNVFMPSHVDSDAMNYATTFGSEINEHTGALITNSLYKRYYNDYITDSFSIKRRKLSYTAKLPLGILTILKLNDRLIIDGDRFIINDMTVNATNQIVNFNLLNDIYNIDDGSTGQEEETPPNPTPDPPDPPPPPGSFSISAAGAISQIAGCALIVNTTKYWDGNEALPTLGDGIYNDINRTSKFNGGGLYYKIANDLVIQISSQAVVIDVYDCAGGNQ